MQRRSPRRPVRTLRLLVLALLAVALALPVSAPAMAGAEAGSRAGTEVGTGGGTDPGSYTNPLMPRIPGDGTVDSCADPTVLHGQAQDDPYWYMYCTTDPLNDEDRDAEGELVFRKIPMMRSLDLVDWTYVGEAFTALPSWAGDDASLWAPDVVYSTAFEQYYLFVVVTDTDASVSGEEDCPSDNAIGVATSPGPTGPWTFSVEPVVAPQRAGPGCNFFWTFDPDVLGDAVGTTSHLYYGSYYGGVFGTRLTLTSDGAMAAQPATMVAIGNRYEGSNVVYRDGFYYLFVSATNCCNGPLTGYSVFVGRSATPLGPFVDREGNSLLAGRVGGTPVISMNGNRWVGTGHNTVFQDAAGQWWTIYHAVDRFDPFFAGAVGFTKRPALLDPLDWVDGWPTVNGGQWASDSPQPAPAGQPGERSRHETELVEPQVPRRLIARNSGDFSGSDLDDAWSWVREPGSTSYGVENGSFRFDTQAADLFVNSNTASVLVRDAPRRDYVVETRVHLDVPAEGCCFNFVQAGLVVYGDDDNFIKLTHASIFETRQTEFAKEWNPPVPEGASRYGNTVVGPPSDWTYLRIVVERLRGRESRAAGGDTESYTAYTSQDGDTWVRGGTWTHSLGRDAQIGLVSMGGSGFTAEFDYVHVSTLRHNR